MVDFVMENPILQSTAIINGNNGQISLYNDLLVLNYRYHSCNVITKIIIDEIITVSTDGGFSLKNRLIQSPKIITKLSDKSKLIVYSVTPRLKRAHQLDVLSTIINFDCEENCDEWFRVMRAVIDKDKSRPKSLTVFINPIGGLKKGVQLFNDKIRPIFELCGIKSTVTITQRRSEAEDHILNKKILDVEGFICVGGDGMFMELVEGLLLKARRDFGLSDNNHGINSAEFPACLRVGIIPAGSTDTVAYSTSGTKDTITAALYVVLGKTIGIDALSVHSNNQFIKYNVSLMGYGFYGNLVAESESLRWMGPRRYEWLGFKNFMSLEAYYGELSYLPVSKKYGNPADGVACAGKCPRCSDESDPAQKDDKRKEWVTIRDRFIAINSFLLSCRCSKSPIGPAPYAHLGNGCTDLVIVRECSRINFLQHLIKSGSYEDHFDFDFVETVRVTEFSFTSLPDNKTSDNGISVRQHAYMSPWNCDGEAIYYDNVYCKVHRQIIKLFSCGISPTPAINGPMRSIINKKEKELEAIYLGSNEFLCGNRIFVKSN